MGLRRQSEIALVGAAGVMTCALAAALSFTLRSPVEMASALTLIPLIALGGGSVAAGSPTGPRRKSLRGLLSSTEPHSRFARRVVLSVLVLAPLVGVLRLAAERVGYVGPALGVGIMAGLLVLTAVVIAAVGVAWMERLLGSTRELERTLAAQRALVHCVLEQMPVGVIIAHAPSGRVMHCNRQAADILGPVPLGGGSIDQLHQVLTGFHLDGRQYAVSEWPLSRAVTEGVVVSNEEIQIVRVDGSAATTINSSAVVRDESGAVIAAVVTFMDITDRKETDRERAALLERTQEAVAQAERASRMKDDFLAVLSHELRTPLNAILGWTHMLRRGHLTGPLAEEALETIERNARAQATLVRDLLDVSGIIGGRLRLEPGEIDAADVLEAAIGTCAAAAAAKGLRIERIVETDTGIVRADRDRLLQVIGQVLSNAVKFTPPGGVVQVSLRRTDAMVEIAVSDTGAGIPPDVLPHVFDRFRQADGRATRAFEGVGLGLSLARDLVELQRGTLEATSEGPGLGATFTIRLPRHDAAAAETETR